MFTYLGNVFVVIIAAFNLDLRSFAFLRNNNPNQNRYQFNWCHHCQWPKKRKIEKFSFMMKENLVTVTTLMKREWIWSSLRFFLSNIHYLSTSSSCAWFIKNIDGWIKVKPMAIFLNEYATSLRIEFEKRRWKWYVVMKNTINHKCSTIGCSRRDVWIKKKLRIANNYTRCCWKKKIQIQLQFATETRKKMKWAKRKYAIVESTKIQIYRTSERCFCFVWSEKFIFRN